MSRTATNCTDVSVDRPGAEAKLIQSAVRTPHRTTGSEAPAATRVESYLFVEMRTRSNLREQPSSESLYEADRYAQRAAVRVVKAQCSGPIIVNPAGERYMNEALPYVEATHRMYGAPTGRAEGQLEHLRPG
jgi:hypothetical protein